ncbi:MAG: peroxiredoxin family protein [Planctomycetota bacterium]
MRRAGAVVCVASLATLVAVAQDVLEVPRATLGEAMPVMSLPRADGEPGEYDLDRLGGRPAVVVFWRPAQSLSLEALRDVSGIHEALGADHVQVVAVDTAKSSAGAVQAALADESFGFPILLDADRALYARLGVIVSPTTFLLDAEGTLRFKIASHPRHYRRIVDTRLRYLLGNIDEAQMIEELEPTVLKIDEELAAAWRMYNLGRKLQAEGKPDDAVALYEQAVTQYPSLTEARCALGFTKLAAGDLQAAARHFQAAVSLRPEAPDPAVAAERAGHLRPGALRAGAHLPRAGRRREGSHVLRGRACRGLPGGASGVPGRGDAAA